MLYFIDFFLRIQKYYFKEIKTMSNGKENLVANYLL